ncbi:MAG: vWA domain-containing protein [Polyangiales bacterium]
MLALLMGCAAEDPTLIEGEAWDGGLVYGSVDVPPVSIDRPTAVGPGVDATSGGADGGSGGGSADAAGGAVSASRELCDDGLDNDLDGQVDEDCACLPGATQPCFEGNPGFAGRGPCSRGMQTCEGTGEFGSWGACVGSGAPVLEACDGADNDCDGEIDEGCICQQGETRPCYGGPPATRGVGLCRDGVQTCIPGVQGQARWGACTGEVLPAPDRCDGFDNDCDGRGDEECQCRDGQSRPCYEGPANTANVGACSVGVQRCVQGLTQGSAWGSCEMQRLPSSESCTDRVDNDCNGRSDCADPACAGTLECRPCTAGGQRFTLTTTPADVLFVVDRSGSMNQLTPDRATRWNALVSAVRAVLPSLDTSLYMGLVIFPDPDACSAPSRPQVPIVQPAASVIASYLAVRTPPTTALTPTLQALQTAEYYLRSTASPRRRFVVLATDGAPNCGGSVSAVVAQIARIRSVYNVDTFVLGIPGGDLTLYPSLNAMAQAGGRARSGLAQFYEAGSTAQLESALRAITAATANCTYILSSAPARPTFTVVQFDGRAVPMNATDGWSFTDTTYRVIRFNGSACRQLNEGAVRSVSASFNCS